MSDAAAGKGEILSAPHILECDYKRSLGSVLSRFFSGLRDRRIEGVRTKRGRVLVPPAEYDPLTGESTTEDFVEVGPAGVVTSWAWVNEPRSKHPLAKPFAFALIQLDGADTAMLQESNTDAFDPTFSVADVDDHPRLLSTRRFRSTVVVRHREFHFQVLPQRGRVVGRRQHARSPTRQVQQVRRQRLLGIMTVQRHGNERLRPGVAASFEHIHVHGS